MTAEVPALRLPTRDKVARNAFITGQDVTPAKDDDTAGQLESDRRAVATKSFAEKGADKTSKVLSKPVVASPPLKGRQKGYVTMADGTVKRRLVLCVDADIGGALDKLAEETGASVKWHAERLLRAGLME